MNERKPNSLEELKQVQTKLQNALVKAEVVHATVGGPAFSRHLQTGGKTDRERKEAVDRVIKIKNKLEQNAIPHLTAHIDLTQELIKDLEQERPRLITLYEDYLSEQKRIEELEATLSSHIAIGRLQPTALERIEKLQKEHTIRGSEPELLKAKTVWEESKAEEEKKEENAVAVPKVEKPEAPLEPKMEERTVLPDGQDVTGILAPQEKRLVAGLKPGSEEYPMTGSELSRFIFGNEVSLEIGKQRLSTLLSIVKRKIGSKDWEVINKTTTGQHRDAEYYLSPMVAVTEEEKKPLPVMKINPETREVQLEGWDTPKKVPGNISYVVLMKLAESSKENVPFLTLDTAAKETGSIKPDRVLMAIYLLRQLIEPDLNNPQLITKTGRGRKSSYCLNTQVEFVGKPREEEIVPPAPEKGKKPITAEEIDEKIAIIERAVKAGAMPQSELDEALRIRATFIDGAKAPEQEKLPEKPRSLRKEPKEIPLPDSQVVTVSGFERMALELFLAKGLETPILSDYVSLNVFGSKDHKARKRASDVLGHLNSSKLKKPGWHIANLTPPGGIKKGQKAQYRLEKIAPVEIQVEPVKPEETAPIIPDESTPPQHLPGSPGEPIYVPWVETEPEKMAEERKILDVVVTYLISHYALYYQDIIRSLSTQIPQRRIRREDGDYFRITSHELIIKSLHALTQMNEESKIWAIAQTWSGEEKQLFTKVERLARNLSQGNVNRLKDKIRGKIISARNLYHGDQPETGWIKL